MALRRHRGFKERKAPELLTLSILVLLLLSGFAYGLRWIEERYASVTQGQEPVPVRTYHESDAGDALSETLRTVFGIPTAEAASLDEQRYLGRPINRLITAVAAPGADVPIEIAFKNLGTATWSPEGKRYVSAYTIKPRYHASVFRMKDWLASYQPARVAPPDVGKGRTGIVRFTARAPKKPGVYQETFQLASENTSWIWGAMATVKLRVASAPPSAKPATASATDPPAVPAQPVVPSQPSLQGALLFQSADRIQAPGGMQTTMSVVFQNSGAFPWKRYGLRLISAKSLGGSSSVDPSDGSWASPEIPVIVDSVVAPRTSVRLTFSFTVPKHRGDYEYRFVLFSDEGVLDGAPLVLPVTAISDVPLPPVPEPAPSPAPEPVQVAPTGDPIIRVGLYTTDKHEEIGSAGTFEARNADNGFLAGFPAGARAQFWYDLSARLYRITGEGINITSASPVRFIQTSDAQVFTMWSYDHRPSWNTSLNDNTFRGIIKLRKNDPNDYVWLIDELPMEQYLAGMAETSNPSPHEFQKALAVAARSYAWHHLSHPGKHWDFAVDATYDQVYRGYGAEIRTPRFKLAAAETRGQVVSYAGEAVVTPYFSSSDGRTRAWTEVWGGAAKPWLVSVGCPYDAAAGRPLSGHGVGMSAWDAISRANAGADYATILKYYYFGTALKTLY